MNLQVLLNKRVMNRHSKDIGRIVSISETSVSVLHDSIGIVKYSFPSAFADTLILEDEDLQEKLKSESTSASFAQFKGKYAYAIRQEIDYLKATGGKRYRIIDGTRIQYEYERGLYLYSFETDAELHFPDGTSIRLWFPTGIVAGQVVACEDFIMMVHTYEDLGAKIESIEFTAESWYLMESLMDRLDEIDGDRAHIAYDLVCKGRSQIDVKKRILLGQKQAIRRASSEEITFIWGPPGTGKTTTLARLALEAMHRGERVLIQEVRYVHHR